VRQRLLEHDKRTGGDLAKRYRKKRVEALKYAIEHFARVNEMLADEGESRRYRFHFVSLSDYDRFFEAHRSAELDRFVSKAPKTSSRR
jgi:hypothetical protein